MDMGSAADKRALGASEWRSGWTVVLAAFLGVSVGAMPTHAMGVLVKPLSEAFGWTRAEISVVPLFVSISTLVLSPLVGFIVDRQGARRVVLWGMPLYAASLAMVSLSSGDLVLFYLLYGLMAVVHPVIGPLIWSLGVASRFDKQRGLALGISMAGMATLGTVTPILTQLALERLGVDLVWVALGLVTVVVGFPLAVLFFYDAKDLRTRPREGRHSPSPHKFENVPQHSGHSFKQAFLSRRFGQMAISFVIGAAVCGLFMIHFASMLTDRGMGPRQAALILGVMAPGTMIGRIAGGFLLDRFFAPAVASFTLLLPLLACLLMLVAPPSIVVGLAVGLAIGFSLGTEGDTLPYLVARYFGLKSYGKIYGLLFGLYSLGFGAGSFIGGKIFEATSSYRGAWTMFVLLLPVAIALIATLGRYPTFAEEGRRPGRGGAAGMSQS